MKDYSQAFINTNGEEFPNTKAVDAGSPGNTNGTEIIADLLNDNWGFSQALLKAASIIPNGEDETADNSQKLEAIKKLYNDADTALKNILTQTITQADNAVKTELNQKISKETTDRTNADKNLQNQINSIMYLIPKDIKTNVEFDTGKTLDGKRMYGMYVKKSFSVKSEGKYYNPYGEVTIANNVTDLIYSEIKCYEDTILSNMINNRSIYDYKIRNVNAFKIPIHIGLHTNVDRLTKKLAVIIMIQHLTQDNTIVPAGELGFNVIGFVFYTK